MESRTHRRDAALRWRSLASAAGWAGLAAIAAWNALARSPFGVEGAGLAAAMTLVLLAALQLGTGEQFQSPRERSVLVAVLVCFLAAQMYYMALASGTTKEGGGVHRGVDFTAYYLAAKMAASGGRHELYFLPLYGDGRMNLATEAVAGSSWQTTARQYGVPFAMPFIYPPAVALLLLPLAWLTFAAAHAWWLILSLAMYLAGAVMAFRVAGIAVSRPGLLPARAGPLRFFPLVGLLCFFPLLDELFYGQIDSLIFALLAGSLLLLSRDRSVGSSLCFALAAIVKLTPFLLLPILVMHRKWRWLALCSMWTAVLVGFSILRSGWEAQWEFATRVLPHLGSGSPTVANASLSAFVQELMAGQVFAWENAPARLPPHAVEISRGAALAVYSLALARMYRLRRERALLRDLMAGILLTLLVSPISWWHHYILALLPLLYFARRGKATVALGARGLMLLVGTNAAGWGATMAATPFVRVGFAAVVPGLVLALLGAELRGATRDPGVVAAGTGSIPAAVNGETEKAAADGLSVRDDRLAGEDGAGAGQGAAVGGQAHQREGAGREAELE